MSQYHIKASSIYVDHLNKQKIDLDLWLHKFIVTTKHLVIKNKRNQSWFFLILVLKIWTWIRFKSYFCPWHDMIRLLLSLFLLLLLLSFRFFFRFRTAWWRWWRRITVRWRWWGWWRGAGIIIWGIWAWVTGWVAGGWGTWGGRGTDRPVM